MNGNVAAVVAHENANLRMIAAKVPDRARPYNTFFEDSRDFPYNGEPVMLYHGGRRVERRRHDGVLPPVRRDRGRRPVLDDDLSRDRPANGGSVAGSIAALNRILEMAVPSKLPGRTAAP